MTDWTPERLRGFSEKVEQAFLDKRIRAPVHLAGGGERELVAIFRDVRPGDWVFSTWRSSHHALLKGIPEDWLFAEVLAGRSMYIISAAHRFLSGSIVGGMLPIACGVALGAKRLGLDERVFVFVGDMAARSGIFHEFLQYCDGQRLPVHVVIEDNGLSTDTPTVEAWGSSVEFLADNVPVTHYRYERVYPHVGILQFVDF